MDALTQPAPRFCSECGRPTSPDELARFGEHMVCPECKNQYVQKLREGVSPVRAFEFGGFWIRFVAVLLDNIILGVAGGIVAFLAMGTSGFAPARIRPDTPPEEALALMGPLFAVFGLVWLLNMAIACAYETFFVCRLGATPGKMAVSLKVVRPDGSPITPGRAVGRYFAKTLSGMILGIGYIIAAFDSEKRSLHDMICDTRVVKVRN